LIGVTWLTSRIVRMGGQQLVAQGRHPHADLGEALPARSGHGVVAEPAAVQVGVALPGLGEGQPVPRPEVGLQQPVVRLDRQAERGGHRRRCLAGPAQRRAERDRGCVGFLDGRDGGGDPGGLVVSEIGQLGIRASGVAALGRHRGLAVAQQQQPGGSAELPGPTR
jgi:hypothetical protein